MSLSVVLFVSTFVTTILLFLFFISLKIRNPIEERMLERRKKKADFKIKQIWQYTEVCPLSFETIFTISLMVSAIIFFVFMFFLNSIILSALAALLSFLILPTFIIKASINKKIKDFKKKLEFGLNMLISSIVSGMPLQRALIESSEFVEQPLKKEFIRIGKEIESGISASDAFKGLLNRYPCEEVEEICSAMELYEQLGGEQAIELLKAQLVNLQESINVRFQVQQQTSGTKTEAFMIALVPPFMIVMLYMMAPDMYSLLWQTSMGKTIIAICIAIMCGGFYMMWNMLKSIDEM